MTPELVSPENNSNNQLLYFTSSSLTKDDETLFFIRDNSGAPNIFTLNAQEPANSRIMRQLTRNEEGAENATLGNRFSPFRT